MKSILIFIAIAAVSTMLAAQTAVSPESKQIVKQGNSDQTVIADTNGYTSPVKVLDLKDEIGLTKDQCKKIEEILENLPVSVSVKEQEISEAELDLCRLFQSGRINEKTLRSNLERIGKLQSELRFVRLQVYIQVKQLLSALQWKRLKEIESGEMK